MHGLLPLLKFGCVGGAVATTATASGLVVYYNKEVGQLFSSSSRRRSNTSNFIYLVAQYTGPTTTNSEAKLFNNKYQNFACKVGTETIDYSCYIYKLEATSTTTLGINLKNIKEEKNAVKDLSGLTAKKNYLVKLSKVVYEKLKAETDKTIKLVDSWYNAVDFGSFTLVGAVATEDSENKVTIKNSNIFVVKLTEVTTNATAAASDTLECKIGETGTETPCKAYKLENASAPYTKDNLSKITTTLTTSDLAVDKYLLIDLQGSSKSIQDVENQVIFVKKTAQSPAESTLVAKGFVEQILIGSIDATTPGSSELLIVENAFSSLIPGIVDADKNSYVLTKGAAAHTNLLTITYEKDEYQCRVIVGSAKYDDANCKIYPFGETNDTFVFDKTKLVKGQEISAQTSLGTDKYQAIKLSQTLQQQLKKLSADKQKVEIIKKDKASNAWNNRLVTLSYVSDLVVGEETLNSLSSELLLVRAKTKTDNSGSSSGVTDFKCTIGADTAVIPCKLHKFSTTQTSNIVKPTHITSLQDSITIHSDFVVGQYYVLELTGERKVVSALQNKEITIKHGETPTELGKVVFDQFIFGKAKVTGALAARNERIYIVEKDTNASGWESSALPSAYRCKLASKTDSSTQDNFDDGCKLTKISSTTTENKIIPAADLKTNPQSGASSTLTLTSDTDHYYRLILDLNRMYNIPADPFTSAEILIEVEGNSKSYGKVKLVHDITEKEPKGNATLIVGKVTTSPSSNNLTAGKCNFESTSTTTGDVACTVYKNSEAGKTDLNKAVFTTAVANGDTFNEDEYFLIKLNDPKTIAELKTHSNIYFKPTKSGATTVSMTIAAILGGDNSGTKKLYQLLTKRTG